MRIYIDLFISIDYNILWICRDYFHDYASNPLIKSRSNCWVL